MLTSPYNFVPLEDRVFRPAWGAPSQDVPFSDGLSGTLDVLLTARSPVYIRGSAPRPAKISQKEWLGGDGSDEFNAWVEFRRDEGSGRYMVPGTSLKGVIRNVVRIVAAGSMRDASLKVGKHKEEVPDALPAAHRGDGLDVADRLFGYVAGNEDALKGRVAFSPLLCTRPSDSVSFDSALTTTLLSPNIEFSAAYLCQSDNHNQHGKLARGESYRKWRDRSERPIRISGWKRYLVPPDNPPSEPDTISRLLPPPKRHGKINQRTAVALRPVRAGTEFRGRVHFHNLRQAELGALVWALTWGGNDDCRHMVGMGKSLGMGSCHLEIRHDESDVISVGRDTESGALSDVLASAQTAFESEMDSFFGKQQSWFESDPMRELLAMADVNNAAALGRFAQFPSNLQQLKKEQYVLLSATQLLKIKDDPRNGTGRSGRSGQRQRQKRNPGRKPTEKKRSIVPSIYRCEVEIVEKRGKRRARQLSGKQLTGAIRNLDPEALPEVGSRWEAEFDLLTNRDAPFKLLARID